MGLIFSYFQYQTNAIQKERELVQKDRELVQKTHESKVAKIETLTKLIPLFTDTNEQTKQYGRSALVLLYKEDKEAMKTVANWLSNVGDVETLHFFAVELDDKTLKHNAAALYALRVGTNINEAEKAKKRNDSNTAQHYYEAAKCDEVRASNLDPTSTNTPKYLYKDELKDRKPNAGCNTAN